MKWNAKTAETTKNIPGLAVFAAFAFSILWT
jgi:hypothetical protein